MIDIKDKKITVIGLGEKTGVWLVRYLSKGGAKVFVTEAKAKENILPTWNMVRDVDAEFEFGGHSLEKALGSTMAVLCPGVPIDSPFVKSLSGAGIEVVSELEFAFRNLDGGKIIAVTGTNGKSTTVTMLKDIFEVWGKRVFVGGNLGTPLISALAQGERYDYYIIEVSTFQLEGTRHFRPDVGILLNVTQNHLDRHGTMENYLAMKVKLFENQTPKDYSILNYDDMFIMSAKGRIISNKLFFSSKNPDADIFAADGKLSGKSLGSETFRAEELSLKGRHNLTNFMAAALGAVALGCPLGVLRSAMKKFRGLDHRIEFSGERDGVKYWDDSKSTTVDSTIKAIESFSEEIILVAGGRDKGSDFRQMRTSIKERVREIVLYGEACQKMEKELSGIVPVRCEKEFDAAVRKAKEIAKSGESVLLSPACASFDQFKDYKERGNRFKSLVRSFIDGK